MQIHINTTIIFFDFTDHTLSVKYFWLGGGLTGGVYFKINKYKSFDFLCL